jgi:branched-chain amino acid transport system ATP-binding protein
MSQAMLQVKTASKHFLGLKAVDEVSLSVRPGEIVSIIGPNGAGKTTFFNLLTGQLAPTSGEVLFEGQPINHLPPHARARLGMGRTFQISKPLIALTALENVMIGAFLRDAPLSVARDKAMAVLEKVGLARLAMRRAGDLTLSERRRLEVARALALQPKIMLLDEVMAGLNQSEVGQAIELLQGLHAGFAILLFSKIGLQCRFIHVSFVNSLAFQQSQCVACHLNLHFDILINGIIHHLISLQGHFVAT